MNEWMKTLFKTVGKLYQCDNNRKKSIIQFCLTSRINLSDHPKITYGRWLPLELA